MVKPEKRSPVRVVCKRCRSEDVTRDAWASWNLETQDWQLGALFNYTYCHRCQADAETMELPFAE